MRLKIKGISLKIQFFLVNETVFFLYRELECQCFSAKSIGFHLQCKCKNTGVLESTGGI